MKKSKATAVTAALFAAAMSASAYGNAAQTEGSTSASADFQTETATTLSAPPTEPEVPLYGPPWVIDPEHFTQPSNELDAEDPTEPYEPEDIIPQPDYGPPYDPYYDEPQPTYGPAPIPGDVYMDGQVDAFDLAYMRMLLNGDDSFYYLPNADVNEDGEFTVEDIEAVQKFISGDIKDFDDPSLIPQTEYGPPYFEEPATAEPTEPIVPVLYGPPPIDY